jgi:predicted phage terminase large subunit-like protein
VITNPAIIRREMNRIEAERDFSSFFKQAWPHVEPASVKLKWGWAMQTVCDHIQALADDEIMRLCVNIPPGLSKSMAASVMFQPWLWTRDPGTRVISGAYHSKLSTRDAQKSRTLIASEWYQQNWGHKVAIHHGFDSQEYYKNTAEGFRYATSTTGSLTGWRGDYVVVDDPLSVSQADSDADRNRSLDWMFETVPSRFNDPDKPKQLLMMQRVHELDHSGHILEELKDDWVHLMLPMEFESDRRCSTSIGFTDPRTYDGELLFPERFSEYAVDAMKKQFRSRSGEYAVAGQLQQRPVSREGGMFKHADVRLLEPDDPKLMSVRAKVRGWDFAASTGRRADWTVGLLLGRTYNMGYVVLDVQRFRAGPGEVEQRLKTIAQTDGHDILQAIPKDPGAAGKSLTASRLQLLHGYPVRHSPETGSKEIRVIPVAAQAEQHQLFVLAGQPWTADFLAELTTFPGSKFDDQVDALSRAFMELSKLNPGTISTIAPIQFYADGTSSW